MIELVLWLLAGTLVGMAVGLIPGLHPNTVLLASIPLFLVSPSAATLVFFVSLSVTNTIANFIPSVFFGAPEPGTALSVLPGHEFLLKGRGMEALFLTVVGGVGVVLLTALSFPFILWFIPFIYVNIQSYIHFLLIALIGSLILQESGMKKLYSLFMVLVSGAAGYLLLSNVSSSTILFPSLTGLFGISTILTSIAANTCLPEQSMKTGSYRSVKGILMGWLSGMLVGILPGTGSAQAGVLSSRLLRGEQKDFMVSLGGINTANMIFTFIALYSLGKVRSGAAWAISQVMETISLSDVYLMLLAAVFSCLFAAFLTLKVGRVYMKVSTRINYKMMNLSVLIFLFLLIGCLTGMPGLFIAVCCAAIGMCCVKLGVKRMYLMGFLMVPTIVYYLSAA